MGFTVLGITAGRKDSNSEILLKEALLACRDQGAEVKMINLRDYNIIECTGSVSYTHLDVYKRQSKNIFNDTRLFKLFTNW